MNDNFAKNILLKKLATALLSAALISPLTVNADDSIPDPFAAMRKRAVKVTF